MNEFNFCGKCGSDLGLDNNFCPKCGTPIISDTSNKETNRARTIKQKKRGILWYILPIILGIIPGIIGYLILRKKDPILAKTSFILGIGGTIIGMGTSIVLYSLELSVLIAGQYLILGLFVCVIGAVICYGAIRLGKKKLKDTPVTGENYE